MPPTLIFRRGLWAAITALFLSAAPASAQVAYTWTGLGSDANWSTAGNWNSSSPGTNPPPPASDLNNTFLLLTGNTQLTNTLNYNLSANTLSFDFAAGPFIVNGLGANTLTIGSGGIGVSSNNDQTINAH